MESMAVESEAVSLDLLLEKVYREGGYDFRDYKRGTVIRRLERRLHATGTKNYQEYMQFLDNHPAEYQRFAEYVTIKSSGFFRNPHALGQIARLILPELVSRKISQGEQSLRFWSTACARGEEPYSIAILLAEFLGEYREEFDISIFATDISQQALAGARAGIYSDGEVADVPMTILEKYFTRNGDGYEVNPDIRQMVSVSSFDLTSTRQALLELDCIFCCNVLIYFQKLLQERVLGMLYDSLATPGYLVMGEVETITGALRERLECLDSRAKIYKKVRNSSDALGGEQYGSAVSFARRGINQKSKRY